MTTQFPARHDEPARQHSAWTRDHLAGLNSTSAGQTIPTLMLDPGLRVPGIDLWDMWPVELSDGTLARFGEASLWLVLSAPAMPDPEERHLLARIRLMSERGGQWRLHGPLFPDGFTPGNREWSGSAIHDPASGRLTVFFTAAGRRGEAGLSFEQRLFQASGMLRHSCDDLAVHDWSAPRESLAADGAWYMRVDQREGTAGTIKAFRDPGFFRDPAGGESFLLFTASCARDVSPWNGVIGMARARNKDLTDWQALPPILTAAGLNNELERPHMRHVDGRYYLFWSTQGKVFAPDVPAGPTGLYGMVAESPLGPFTPLNGSGLVAGNPPGAPAQAYSWWVLGDLRVNAFVDLPGVADPAALVPGAERRAGFGGYPAPFFRIALEGDRASIV